MMKRKTIRNLLSILFGLACLLIWIRILDIKEFTGYLSQIHPGLAILAGLAYIVSYIFRSLRWNTILSTIQSFPVLSTFAYYMAGNFTNYLIPIRAGELAKCYFIKRKTGIRVSRTLPTVFIDKLFDSAAIFLVLFMIPFLPVHINKSLWILIALIFSIVIIGISFLVASSLAHEKMTNILVKLFFFVPKKYQTRINEISSIIVEGIGLFRHHTSLLPQIVLLTIMAVLTDSLVVLLLFWSFGVSINYFVILFGYTLIYLSYVLPHPPAQIGSNELLMVLIFNVGFGFNKNLVSAVMSFGHLLTGAIIVVLGIATLSWTGFSLFSSSFSQLDEKEPE